MDAVIVVVATYLLYVMAAGFAAVWWFDEDRSGKLHVVVAAIIGLVLVGVFIAVAGAVHDDPRPFMQDPSLNNLLHHAPGNGFPSDHSCAAGLIAGLVVFRHRLFGALLAVGAVLVAAARVAAHAHHLQDVGAGLALGVLAAWLATMLATALVSRLELLRRLGVDSKGNAGPRVKGS